MSSRSFAVARPPASITFIDGLSDAEIDSIAVDLPATKEQFAKLSKKLERPLSANTVYTQIKFCYTTSSGEIKPLGNVVMTIDNCGFPIWKSVWGDHIAPTWTDKKKGANFTVNVRESQSPKGYRFCVALSAAYNSIHEDLWKTCKAFINQGKKGPMIEERLKIASLLYDEGGETKKNSRGEDFVTQPQFKYRIEYQIDLGNRGLPKCKVSELTRDEDNRPTFVRKAVMPSRRLTREAVQQLKGSDANYHFAFKLFRDWYQDYPEVVALCAKSVKYDTFFDQLADLADSIELPDFLTNVDLQEQVFQRGNRLDVEFEPLEVALSREKGSCFSLKAKSLRYYQGASVPEADGPSDDDYLAACSSSSDIDQAIAAAAALDC